MTNRIKTIIELINNGRSCRGLEGKTLATEIIKPLFEKENINFENWQVSEIPVAEESTEYPVVLVICLANYQIRKGFSIGFSADENIICINPDALCRIAVNTIKAAINRPESSFDFED